MHGRYYRCAAGNWAGDRRKKRNRGGVIGSGIGSFDCSQLATPDSTILFACTSVITDKLTIDRSIGDFYNVKSTYLFVTKLVIGSIDRGPLKNFASDSFLNTRRFERILFNFNPFSGDNKENKDARLADRGSFG